MSHHYGVEITVLFYLDCFHRGNGRVAQFLFAPVTIDPFSREAHMPHTMTHYSIDLTTSIITKTPDVKETSSLFATL